MVVNGRNRRNGQFTPGHRFAKGRPPRSYSITSALAAIADEPQTIDDDGNPITNAHAAAQWLWKCVLDEELSYRDRLNALETVLNRVEPKITLTGKDIDDVTDSEAELVIAKLDELSTDELKILEKLALGRLG